MNFADNPYVGISIFIFLIAFVLAFVSVHYRNKYEELKEMLG